MRRSAAVYHKFTEDEIRQANSVDILSLARGYGYEPEKAGRKAVHMKHSGGLYIFPENNRFFQWTGPDDGIKGGAIDFVMREENLSFPEAVGKLIGKEYAAEARQVTPYEKKERGPLALPEKADNMKRAYWYLVSIRGISPQIVSHFMNRKMIYQEKKYGNCVFVGYDAEGTPRYCSMRAARENSHTVTEPMAPASAALKKPARIPPMMTKMSSRMGKIPVRETSFSFILWLSPRGRTSGCLKAMTSNIRMNKAHKMRPGMTPAMNRRPVEVSVTMA